MSSLSFIPLQKQHFSLLHKWLQEPYVWQWWGEGKTLSLHDIEHKYWTYTQNYKIEEEQKPIYPFVIAHDEQPIGYIQYYHAFDFRREKCSIKEIWKEKSSLAALDFYIGEPNFLGKGIGSRLLEKFLKEKIFYHFEACLVDPDKSNKFAIKAYANAGFTTFEELPSSIVMVAKKNSSKNPLVILGSSRSDGQTRQAIEAICQYQTVPIVDLIELNISYYDYAYRNREDDFISLAETMIKHNPIVLATPVYWYTMSAVMKTFIDRWSDLLDIRKDLGYRLTAKELYVITSYATSFPEGFEDVFAKTCDYLKMKYQGCFYFYPMTREN